MILCLCRGISDRDVVEAVRGGARSLEDLSRHCDGAGGDCGSCQAYLELHLQGRAEPPHA